MTFFYNFATWIWRQAGTKLYKIIHLRYKIKYWLNPILILAILHLLTQLQSWRTQAMTRPRPVVTIRTLSAPWSTSARRKSIRMRTSTPSAPSPSHHQPYLRDPRTWHCRWHNRFSIHLTRTSTLRVSPNTNSPDKVNLNFPNHENPSHESDGVTQH